MPQLVFHFEVIALTPAFALENDLVLAPMDGYTDSPMRRLCRRFGASLCYTEFISTHEYLHRSPFITQKLTFLPEERPIIFQLLGEDASDLLRVAQELLPLQLQAFDIN
jgi:tRNA-dihydrouridine synthase